jgi:hypothetical protein
LTRTRFTASSIARAFVKAITAPLVATYDVALACPNVPTHEARFMMQPSDDDEDDDDDDDDDDAAADDDEIVIMMKS